MNRTGRVHPLAKPVPVGVHKERESDPAIDVAKGQATKGSVINRLLTLPQTHEGSTRPAHFGTFRLKSTRGELPRAKSRPTAAV